MDAAAITMMWVAPTGSCPAAWLRRPPPARPAGPDRPGVARALFAAGASAERMGELEDARLRYECVLLIEPGHARARQRLRALAAG